MWTALTRPKGSVPSLVRTSPAIEPPQVGGTLTRACLALAGRGTTTGRLAAITLLQGMAVVSPTHVRPRNALQIRIRKVVYTAVAIRVGKERKTPAMVAQETPAPTHSREFLPCREIAAP